MAVKPARVEEMDRTQAAKDRPLFPDGYAIPMLEGERRPTRSEVKRAMAQRALWLLKKIRERSLRGDVCTFYFAELAAIAELMDCYDAASSPESTLAVKP